MLHSETNGHMLLCTFTFICEECLPMIFSATVSMRSFSVNSFSTNLIAKILFLLLSERNLFFDAMDEGVVILFEVDAGDSNPLTFFPVFVFFLPVGVPDV